jgi:hypothetical protein
MIAVIVLAAVHLAVLGIWFLPRSVWQWLDDNANRLLVLLRAVPMLVAVTWFTFGILAPVIEAEVGPHAPKPWDGLVLGILLSPFLLVLVTMMFAWPLVMLPPGARSVDARGESRWFEQHPLPGLGIIGLLIIVGIAIGYASHH